MKDAEFKEFKLSLPKIKRRLKTLSDDTEKKIKKKDGFTALQLCEIVYKYKMILEFDPFLICFLQSANDFPALLESKTESTASVLLGLPDKFLQHLLPHLNTKQAVTFFNRCKSAKLLQLLGVYSKLNTGFLDEIIKNPLKYKTYLLFELLLEFDRSVVATKINRNASLWGKAIEAVINDNKTQVDRYGLGETTQIDCSVLTPFLKFEISSLSCITALMIKKHKSHWDHTGIIGLLVEVDSHSVDVDFQRVMPELGLRAAKDSIALYERGAELKKHCETKLKQAEEKVAAITLDGSGQPSGTTPVEGL